jgi:O-antigen ligase
MPSQPFRMALHARLQGVVFWLAVWTTLLSALFLGANRPVSWLALAGIALVLFAVQAGLDLFDRDAPGRWRRILPVAILYLGVISWAMIQAGPAPIPAWAHPAWAEVGITPGAISVDPGATWQGILRLLTYAALFWIAAQGGRPEVRTRRFIATVALWSVALALYGLVAMFADFNPITGGDGYKGIVTASYINPNSYALYAGLGAIACLSALAFHMPIAQRRRETRRKVLRDLFEALTSGGWVYLTGFAILATAILYTESRAGTLTSLAGVGVILTIILARRGRVWWIATWAIVALPVVAASIGAWRLGDQLAQLDPLEDGRIEIYERILVGIEAAPWLGHGLGAFQDGFRPYMTGDVSDKDWDLAHSAYLENAFELGLPATGAMVLALLLIAWRLRCGTQTRRRMRPAPAFALAALTAGGLHSLVDFSLQMPATTAFLAMTLGIGWTQSRREV